MEIVIQNRNGRIELGGGEHPSANLVAIEGVGLPARSPETIKYSGQAGYKILNVTDMERTITMSLDFKGMPFDVMKAYNVLQEECELLFFLGDCRRKIKGICITPPEPEKIIYQRMYKLVLQFVCESPYFEDFCANNISLSTRTDMFPTSFEGGKGYITLPAVATERTATISLKNKGDMDVYPVVTITADEAAETLVVSNITSGKSITLNKPIAEGETVIFDVANREITSDIDGNCLNYLSDDTILSEFMLHKGNNEVIVTNGNLNALTGNISYKNQYKAVVMI